MAGPFSTLPRDIANFSANSRTLLYVPAVDVPQQVVSFDPTGKQVETIGQPGNYSICDVSPDGTKAAIRIAGDSGDDVWVMQLDGGMLTRTTFSSASFVNAVFSSDGNRLACSVAESNRRMVLMIQSLDSGATEKVLQESLPINVASWSSDGQTLASCS